MTVARARLLIAAVLFFGWLCWLGYLAFTQTNPVVVSRSQVMAADRFIVGEVSLDPATGALNKNVTVVQDLRPDGAAISGTVEVRNLEEAEVTGGENRFHDRGRYLMMLNPVMGPDGKPDGKAFYLTSPPGRANRSPGVGRGPGGRPWVYTWDNPAVQRQFKELTQNK
jgi:hypothetical protein